MTTKPPELLQRYKENPILTAADWPYPINSAFNPGAVRLNGVTLLLCRVEDRRGLSHLCAARSVTGRDAWDIEPVPTLMPDPEHFPEEIWGIEDPRITFVPELDQYAVVYTAYARGGPCVALALTEDFRHFKRMGVVMQPEDKDAALLPRRIGGHWALVHRPSSMMTGHMWMSYSDDLRNWGGHEMMLEARRGGWWDADKIGLSCPLIETPQGWLGIYHGVKRNAGGAIYRLGLALFDLEAPGKCLRRGDEWILGPQEPYELQGDTHNVIFPCGCTVGADGDALHLYYGAADSSIATATGSIRSMLAWLGEHGSTPHRMGR
jgi:predicted GH43/DUF377 family glycosyl hydrolase